MTDMNISNVNKKMMVDMLNTLGLEGVKSTSVVNAEEKTLTVTLKNAAGQTSQITFGLPDLDNPTLTKTTEVAAKLKEVAAKISSLAESLKASTKAESGVTSSVATTNILFDIYALINTLQKVAQQQRKTASDVRKADHELVQASLKNSAASIRSAADISSSMALGMAITASVTALAAVGSTYFTCSNTKQANAEAGLGAAKDNLSAAKTQLDQAKGLAASQGQDNHLNTLKADQGLKTKLEELGVIPKQDSVLDNNAKVARAEDKVQLCQQDLAAKQGKLDIVKNGTDEAAKTKAMAEWKTADAELKTAELELKQAKADRSDAIFSAKEAIDEKIASMPEGEAKTQLTQARDGFMSANKEAIVEGCKTKVETLKGEFAAACKLSTETESAQAASKWKTLGDLAGQLGNVANQWLSRNKANKEAEAQAKSKEGEAQIEGQRAQLDSAKELYDEAVQMQQSINEMRKSIEQMDRQLAQTIMRA